MRPAMEFAGAALEPRGLSFFSENAHDASRTRNMRIYGENDFARLVSKFTPVGLSVRGSCVHENRTLAHNPEASETRSRTHMLVRVRSPMAAY